MFGVSGLVHRPIPHPASGVGGPAYGRCVPTVRAMRGRTDATQSDIVAALKAVGASVLNLYQVGGGCFDILVGYQGQDYPMEVKTDIGRVSSIQKEWHENWRGRPVTVVRCPDDALRCIGAIGDLPLHKG